MTASITALKTGLKVRFATITGLRTYATMPAKPEPPAVAILGPTNWQYDQDFDGLTAYTFEAHLFVNPADLTRAQTALDAYLAPTGASSLRAAVDADIALGGLAHFARVLGGNGYARLVESAGGQLLSAVVEVEVRAT
jgi:hypothetical protein